MVLLVVRCANGRVLWRKRVVHHADQLLCVNDGFSLDYPAVDANIVPFLQAIVQHSSGLQGAVQSLESITL